MVVICQSVIIWYTIPLSVCHSVCSSVCQVVCLLMCRRDVPVERPAEMNALEMNTLEMNLGYPSILRSLCLSMGAISSPDLSAIPSPSKIVLHVQSKH